MNVIAKYFDSIGFALKARELVKSYRQKFLADRAREKLQAALGEHLRDGERQREIQLSGALVRVYIGPDGKPHAYVHIRGKR